MRNLRNVQYTTWDQRTDITSTCWDPSSDVLLCTVGPGEDGQVELLRISAPPHRTTETICMWNHAVPSPEISKDRVVSVHHFNDTLTTCLIFEGGDIYTIRENDGGEEAHVEIVGGIDAGIAAARWSPDEEILAIATKADTLVLMGRTLDPVADVPMTPNDLEASKHVSVGWGKKETQFQGRGAKALRDPTIPEKVDEGTLSTQDDRSTTISWRGDGAFVAINAIVGNRRRAIRVYNREGGLDSVSEPVDGLEGSLSWRPAGNLLAGIQRLPDRTDVVFFERNGLRHGEFTLRAPVSKDAVAHGPIQLEWNADSTVLAVLVQGTVQLWTMGNYHWYLKQEIPTTLRVGSMETSMCDSLRGFAWHPEKALRFACVMPGSITTAEYVFGVARGATSPPHDYGAVAVVDGKSIKVTPFRTANVPPPMALFDLEEPSTIIDVAFSPSNSMMAVLYHGGVALYQWQAKAGRSSKPAKMAELSLRDDEGPPRLNVQTAFSGESTFSILHRHGDEATLGHYSYVTSGVIESLGEDLLEDEILAISSNGGSGTSTVAAQCRDGRLLLLGRGAREQCPIKFPVQVPWFEIRRIDGDKMLAFGLSRNGHLYANSSLLVKACTSFVVTSSHLIFTTNNHLVKFVHLRDASDLDVPPDDPEKDERCRSIERGARLVTAMPTTMSLVLQMPRGNLETIYPRAMVVAGIRELIDEKRYEKAFKYCRTQRVDMNILFDHQPDQFLTNVDLFVEQLKEVPYIDLFLSSLREEDVTQSMYQDTKPKIHTQSDATPEVQVPQNSVQKQGLPRASKVNQICEAMIKSLTKRKASNLQNIITAHVCKVPPALDDGLTLVAELMQEDEGVAEKAVEHICFLVDVNRLYDHALGLYNLDLTLLVAQQSQRDPREYLPFIQDLHKQPELRRKFSIDDHLGRREKALAHLKALDVFSELSAYTVKHTLYQKALQLYRYDQARHKAVTDLFATHLESTSQFREAGLAHESLGNFAKATFCYRAAGASCWRECLYTAQQQTPPLPGAAMSDLAAALAEALWEAKDYAAAATVHLEYLSSLEMALKCLCKAYQFGEAMRLVVVHKRPELMTAVVDVGLADALGSTTEFLADCKSQLLAQVPRIFELRRKAAEDPLGFYEGDRIGGPDVPDDVSVAASSKISTSASLFTRYTGKGGSVGTVGTGVSRATSKNRRREEKKRARGRKGTVYEEEYLVNSVRRLVDRVEGLKSEVERLVFALVRRDMAERARAAEALLAEVVEACKAAIAQIFDTPQTTDGTTKAEDASGDRPEGWSATGADAVLQDALEARMQRQAAPVITGMPRLSLLGG